MCHLGGGAVNNNAFAARVGVEGGREEGRGGLTGGGRGEGMEVQEEEKKRSSYSDPSSKQKSKWHHRLCGPGAMFAQATTQLTGKKREIFFLKTRNKNSTVSFETRKKWEISITFVSR